MLFGLISQHVTIFIFLSRLRLGDPSGPAVIWTATSIHFHVRTISYMFFARSLNQCDFSIAVASLPAQLTEESWWYKDGHCVVTCFFCLLILCLWNFISRLREGIKLKIPPELLYKKGMKSREQSQALLEEVHSECHEANVWLLDNFQAQLSHWHKKGGTIFVSYAAMTSLARSTCYFDLFGYGCFCSSTWWAQCWSCWCMLLMCGSFSSFLLAHC